MHKKFDDMEGETRMKGRRNFIKGVIFGAVVSFATSLLLFVALFGKNSVSGLNGDDLIDKETMQKIQYIRQLIDENYLYSDEISDEELQDALIKGYVAGLKEPYSIYYSKEEANALFETTSGTFGGIGVAIQQDRTTGLITFTRVYENAPGEKGGFKAGDVVYKVNGEDVSGQDLDTVVSKIRGEVGTQVELTVLRGDTREEYTAKVTRALIENDTVSYEMKEGKIGYILITGFEEVTYKQFNAALDALNSQGMVGLVIDLRNNPGGNLSTVCQMVDLILGKGNVVSIKDKHGNTQSYTSDEATKLHVPMVVLTNGYSASASEIFAGAVQDYKIGTIVGTTTYGKGIVQNVYRLYDGTALKITSAEYFTAKGRNIHGIGIIPDVEIEYKSDAENPNADNQLEKALEILKKGM